LAPSPKFQETLLIDTDERLGITVNVIGVPTVPTLVEEATETEKLVGLLVK
jgi:hypothetical protein